MPLPLGLTADEYEAYLETLASSYEMKVTAQVLTNRHAVVSTISHQLLDGQVDAQAVKLVDHKVEVSRTCRMQFVDPAGTLQFDSASPTNGAVYLDRMVRAIVSVRCEFGWVDVPVFTGPVTGVDRDEDLVTVDAAGKETFGLRAAWYPTTITGFKVAAVKAILRMSGESDQYIQIPDSPERLTAPAGVRREETTWQKAFWLMQSLNQHLFYDGRGITRTTPTVSKPVITFRTGRGGLVTSEPQIRYSTDNLINTQIVRGGPTPGTKPTVYAQVVAPREHPLSPWQIGRDDQGRGGFLVDIEDNPDIRTTPKAVQRAQANLTQSLNQGTEATWDCHPVWHLEPWDMATLLTEKFNGVVPVGKYSLPLRADADMTVGYQKDLAKPRRIVRSE